MSNRYLTQRIRAFLPGIITEEENKSWNSSQGTEDEKMNPSKPFRQIPGRRGNDHPRNAHKTAQKRILCGSKPLVAETRHKGYEGGNTHTTAEIFECDRCHQYIIIVACRSKRGE